MAINFIYPKNKSNIQPTNNTQFNNAKKQKDTKVDKPNNMKNIKSVNIKRKTKTKNETE